MILFTASSQLFQRHLRGVQQDRVLRLFQRRDLPVGIVVVPLFHIPQDGFVGGVDTFFPVLLKPALRPLLRRGGQEDFDRRVRQDDRPMSRPSIRTSCARASDRWVSSRKARTPGIGRDPRSGFGGSPACGWLPRRLHRLARPAHPVHMPKRQGNLRQQLFHRLPVGGDCPRPRA